MKEDSQVTSKHVIDVLNTPNADLKTGKTAASNNTFKKCSSNKK